MIDYYCGDKMKRLIRRNNNYLINKNIDKSLKIIKKEKLKIKEEKQKIKNEKEKKFYNSCFGKFLKDYFDVKDVEVGVSKIIRKKVFSNLMNVFFGIILCLAVLFVLSGGKNYLKLYYQLEDLIDIYDTINNEYYGEFDREEVINSAISSMVDSVGDVYTTYSDKTSTDSFLEDLDGTYEGIGCSVSTNENGDIYVVEVFEDSPAFKSGLLKNDIILKIDNIDYSDKTAEDMSMYVKNEAKKEINLVVFRDEKEVSINLVREKVEIPCVSSELIDKDNKKIGYIKIDIFSSIADSQFEKELKKLEKKKIQGLIIDVRNNTGGYLDVVTDISSLFLKKDQVIYQLEMDDQKKKIKDETEISRTYPIVVLVNGNSASASEILAASIKESYNGYVVGINTYGKGTVQKTKTLKNGNMIKYTVQKWLTPNGKYIDKNGVSPTDVVEFEQKGYNNDSQLDYSINLIVKGLNVSK